VSIVAAVEDVRRAGLGGGRPRVIVAGSDAAARRGVCTRAYNNII